MKHGDGWSVPAPSSSPAALSGGAPSGGGSGSIFGSAATHTVLREIFRLSVGAASAAREDLLGVVFVGAGA